LTLISLATFAVVAIVLGLASELNGVTYLGVFLWGLTFGGAPTLLQTAMADAAGEGADVAQSMLVTIFNLAVAGGGIVGGFLLEQMGAGPFPWTLAFLSLFGLLTVWVCKNNAFKPDRRS
jgi:predicted MFS family arabinose efflux permease